MKKCNEGAGIILTPAEICAKYRHRGRVCTTSKAKDLERAFLIQMTKLKPR